MLVVAQHSNTEKVRRHWAPLADVTDDVTMVCLDSDPDVEAITFRTAPAPVHRVVGIVSMFFVAVRECARADYDAVASMSLFPYGCYALVLGRLFGLPTHLGIIGIDLDHHAVNWYGRAVRALFQRFSSISVPGTSHRQRLIRMGVPGDRISILSNAFDADRFRPSVRPAEPAYDFVWVGRFNREKNPLLFVRALGELRVRGVEFDAAIVGAGPLADAVTRERDALGLGSDLSVSGWVEDPLVYYAQAETFVVTSERDALPLTLLESMATGAPPVVTDVGSVTDVVDHCETGYVVAPPTPTTLADALERLDADDDLRSRLSNNASRVRDAYSYDAARDDWRQILDVLARA